MIAAHETWLRSRQLLGNQNQRQHGFTLLYISVIPYCPVHTLCIMTFSILNIVVQFKFWFQITKTFQH